MFPGIIAAIFFTLNLFIWEEVGGAVPDDARRAPRHVLRLVPLVFLGALGYRRPQLSYPTKTNHTARRAAARV